MGIDIRKNDVYLSKAIYTIHWGSCPVWFMHVSDVPSLVVGDITDLVRVRLEGSTTESSIDWTLSYMFSSGLPSVCCCCGGASTPSLTCNMQAFNLKD